MRSGAAKLAGLYKADLMDDSRMHVVSASQSARFIIPFLRTAWHIIPKIVAIGSPLTPPGLTLALNG